MTSLVTASVNVSIGANYLGTTKSATLRVFETVPANLAMTAAVSVSSESTSTSQTGTKAVDGIVDGYPGDSTREWATNGQVSGAWIRLTWPNALTVSQVVLYDRPNTTDNIISGTLTFSDGSSLSVGQLPNGGSTGLVITMSPKVVTWVQFTVNSAVGQNSGLSEITVN
jgi:hypothetical protein